MVLIRGEAERESIIRKWETVHKPKGIQFLGLFRDQQGCPNHLAEIIEGIDHELGNNACVEWLRAIPLNADIQKIDDAFLSWHLSRERPDNYKEDCAQMFEKLMEITKNTKA